MPRPLVHCRLWLGGGVSRSVVAKLLLWYAGPVNLALELVPTAIGSFNIINCQGDR